MSNISPSREEAAKSDFDHALALGAALEPAERQRLIERLRESLPREELAPGDRQAAQVSSGLPSYEACWRENVPPEVMARIAASPQSDEPMKIYSAPRRFDLATIFVVTSAYAALFAGMTALNFPPIASGAVAGFVTLVGLAQALLFRGRQPRLASVLVGTAIYSLAALAIWLASGQRRYPTALVLLAGTYSIIGGAILGYLSGALIGGVFLIADVLRGRFGRRDG
jgi:hypothetical protein